MLAAKNPRAEAEGLDQSMESHEHAKSTSSGNDAGAQVSDIERAATERVLGWFALALFISPFVAFAVLLATGRPLVDYLPPHTLAGVGLFLAGVIAARPKQFWDYFGLAVSIAIVWGLLAFGIHWLAIFFGFQPHAGSL